MKNSFSYLKEEEQNKNGAVPVNKAEHLFLDTLCTYFEIEQILDKAQIERFRKIWLVQEQKVYEKENDNMKDSKEKTGGIMKWKNRKK